MVFQTRHKWKRRRRRLKVTHTHTEQPRREFSGTLLVIVARKIWKMFMCVSCLSPPVRKTRELFETPFSQFYTRKKFLFFSRSHFELFRGGWGSSST
jgi:hypothetical protein